MKDDELGTNPREADYLDDYDMPAAINFHEIKGQLANLGFTDPGIADRLSDRILGGTYDFRLPYQENIGDLMLDYSFDIHRNNPDGTLLFDHIDAAIYQPGEDKYFYAIFSPEISRTEVRQVLQKGFNAPFMPENIPDYFDRSRTRVYLKKDKNQNFQRLKTQLNDMGFVDPGLIDTLRTNILDSEKPVVSINYRETRGEAEFRAWFEFWENEKQKHDLVHLEAMLSYGKEYTHRLFEPNITRDKALKLLQEELRRDLPGLPYSLPDYLNKNESLQKKVQIMNTENLNYLQKQLLNLGFGEKLNQELEKNIKSGKKEFTLTTDQEYNKQNVDYTLHYKAGDQNDMYFFNKYDAALRDKEMQQTFYINKGSGITAKEAYNLMEGRAVHKQLENLEGEKYNAWIIIDKENKTENGNFKLRPFTEGWNYKPERAIDKLAIVGIDDEGAREKLMKSMEKGNRHQVTAMKDGKEVKLFLEANPAEHRVNLTNWKGEAQQLEHYKKPELKNDNKKDQKQAQTAEDAPEKKQRKAPKMKV